LTDDRPITETQPPLGSHGRVRGIFSVAADFPVVQLASVYATLREPRSCSLSDSAVAARRPPARLRAGGRNDMPLSLPADPPPGRALGVNRPPGIRPHP